LADESGSLLLVDDGGDYDDAAAAGAIAADTADTAARLVDERKWEWEWD
jgi:hypothetical protein